MRRTHFLVIRVTKAERDTIVELAQTERLPTSTLARQILLKRAEQCGIPLGTRKDPRDKERQID